MSEQLWMAFIAPKKRRINITNSLTLNHNPIFLIGSSLQDQTLAKVMALCFVHVSTLTDLNKTVNMINITAVIASYITTVVGLCLTLGISL